jgi:hypothetical protein
VVVVCEFPPHHNHALRFVQLRLSTNTQLYTELWLSRTAQKCDAVALFHTLIVNADLLLINESAIVILELLPLNVATSIHDARVVYVTLLAVPS